MKALSDIQFKYTCNHNQVDTCCHVTVFFKKFVSHYPGRHLTTDHHQALVAERSKALQRSCRGLAGRGFESRWRHIFSF